MQYIKKEYSVALGDRTAEEIKKALGSAWPLERELKAEIRGRDLVTGLPKTIELSTVDIRDALAEPVAAICDAVKMTLDQTPPELAPTSWSVASASPVAVRFSTGSTSHPRRNRDARLRC